MIKSFADVATRDFWNTGKSRRLPTTVQATAKRKLTYLNAAVKLKDLRSNRLHALHGNCDGQHAIWINDQYRICFAWRDGDAYEVEITDYH